MPGTSGEYPVTHAAGETADDALISVIIPCFNHSHFLGEAIESVLTQAYPCVEVVVVDDGSTDETATVSARYPTVRYVRQAHQGLAAARNTGIARSAGEYLAFVDADDLLLPDALAISHEWLCDHPDEAFVSGHYRFRYGDKVRLAERKHPAHPNAYCALLQCNYITMHGAVLYRRGAVVAVGGFDQSLKACEDYDLYVRLARSYSVGRHNAVVAEYRQHDANMTRDAALMLQASVAALQKQRPHVAHHPEYQQAYASGMRFWHDLYGVELLQSVGRDLRLRCWRRAARDLTTLMRYGPAGIVARTACRLLIRAARRQRVAWRSRGARRVGGVDFGALRSVIPVSREFGFDRGQPIDRYYIERFLAGHASDIRGRVLEIGDDAYTRAFGGAGVTAIDVLHVAPGNPAATIIADLASAAHIPADSFDCILLTQTLHLIYDLHAAARTLFRILRPGGVVLATVPGISQISSDGWKESWYWSLTPLSATRLFTGVFGADHVTVAAFGNVLAATAFLHGLAATELTPDERDVRDPHYPMLITVRATKPSAAGPDV